MTSPVTARPPFSALMVPRAPCLRDWLARVPGTRATRGRGAVVAAWIGKGRAPFGGTVEGGC